MGVFTAVSVGVDIGIRTGADVAVEDTKGTLLGCSETVAILELGNGGRNPAKEAPIRMMTATPPPMSNPMPRCFKSGCILIKIVADFVVSAPKFQPEIKGISWTSQS